MNAEMRALGRAERYKILASCVTPRPIAWVTSRAPSGLVNAAPYSFFNVLGDDPATIALGLLRHRDGTRKDTARNILDTGEFVVNLVREADGEAMNLTCVEAPAEQSEVDLAGLRLAASVQVVPPRIATAPASFECRVLHAIETGPCQLAVIAEVVHAHLADDIVLDATRMHINTTAMGLIARMHGEGWYSRQTDLFQMARPTWPLDTDPT